MLEGVYYRRSICLVCALALLTSPLRSSRSGSMSFLMTCLMRNCSTPPTPSTLHCFKSTADGYMANTAEFGREVENEEVEEYFVGVTGSASFLISPPLSTSLKRPAKQTAVFGLMKSSPMLRC